MPKNEKDLKWACAYCTYENWPSTKKCTLCYTPQPPHVITNQTCKPVSISEDIYEAGGNEIISTDPLICPPNSKNSQKSRGAGEKEEIAKWSCMTCTYENWARSLHCVMCRAPKTKHCKNGNHGEGIAANKEKARALSPKSSRSIALSKHDSKTINNDRNKALLKKWVCMGCTYENWPKALKCVICKEMRVMASKQVMGKHDEDVGNSSRKPSTSRFRSPPLSLSETTLEIEQSNQSKEKIIYDIPASDDVNENEEVLQIRNCLKDSDWMWLSACVGIAEGDANSVESYLNSGEDLSRKLTKEDCLVLNRPGSFEVGYTLVHLAIKFKRDDLLAIMLAPEVVSHGIRRVPCLACPDLAADIRRNIAHTIRQRKGDWPCYFLTDQVTFALPAGKISLSLKKLSQYLGSITYKWYRPSK